MSDMKRREFMPLVDGAAACRSRRALLANSLCNPQPAAGAGDRSMGQA